MDVDEIDFVVEACDDGLWRLLASMTTIRTMMTNLMRVMLDSPNHCLQTMCAAADAVAVVVVVDDFVAQAFNKVIFKRSLNFLRRMYDCILAA